jgi:hypothetical protein
MPPRHIPTPRRGRPIRGEEVSEEQSKYRESLRRCGSDGGGLWGSRMPRPYRAARGCPRRSPLHRPRRPRPVFDRPIRPRRDTCPSPTFLDLPRPSPTFPDLPRPSSTFPDLPRPSPTFLDLPRPSSTFLDLPRPSSTFPDIPRPSSTFLDLPRPPRPRVEAEESRGGSKKAEEGRRRSKKVEEGRRRSKEVEDRGRSREVEAEASRGGGWAMWSIALAEAALSSSTGGAISATPLDMAFRIGSTPVDPAPRPPLLSRTSVQFPCG